MFHTFVQFLPSLYSTQLSELGRSVVNLCSIVPGGLVCFFPSYEHERNAFAFWQQSGILDSISKKKQVRMCVWLQALCTLPGAMCFISLVLFIFVVTPVDYCPCLWTGMCSFLVWTVTDAVSCHWVSVCCLLLAIGLICTHQRCSSVEPQLGKGFVWMSSRHDSLFMYVLYSGVELCVHALSYHHCLQPVDLQGAQTGIAAGHSAHSVCKMRQGAVWMY